MPNKCVIGIKRIRDYNGESLPADKQYWEYVQCDEYTGYPCLGYEVDASKFHDVEYAKTWWDQNKKYFSIAYLNCFYDVSTLSIKEVIVRLEEKVNLCDTLDS